jgi:hypothetical protein
MSGFFWTSGHLGWGIFALLVFTVLWWVAVDLYWRLNRFRLVRFLVPAVTSWALGAGIVVLVFYLSHT